MTISHVWCTGAVHQQPGDMPPYMSHVRSEWLAIYQYVHVPDVLARHFQRQKKFCYMYQLPLVSECHCVTALSHVKRCDHMHSVPNSVNCAITSIS